MHPNPIPNTTMTNNKRAKTTRTQEKTKERNPPDDERDETRRKVPTTLPEGAIIINKGGSRPMKPTTTNLPKFKKYAPPLPPTIKIDGKRTQLGTGWRVEYADVHEGTLVHPAVHIISPYADRFPDTHTTTNPHWIERKPPADTNIAPPPFPCTTGPLPNAVVDEATVYGALDPQVAIGVRNHADDLIAVIPYGAGNKLFEQKPETVTIIQRFLRSLLMTNGEDGDIEVQRPAREGKPPHNAKFAKPFPVIIAGLPKRIREYLLAVQVFAFRQQTTPCAFLVIDPMFAIKPWVIYTFRGDYVTRDEGGMTRALTAVAKTIEGLIAVKNHVNKVMASQNLGSSAEERLQMVLATMSLVYVERKESDGRTTPLWQLHGCPISTNSETQREWLKTMRRIRFLLKEYTVMEPEKTPFGCVWCKSMTHDGAACPLPLDKDWKGPIPEEGYHALEYRDIAPTRKEGRRRKAGKGKGTGVPSS